MAFANRDVELASDLATNQPSQKHVRFSVVPLLMNWERALLFIAQPVNEMNQQ